MSGKMQKGNMESEALLKERVEKSPLRFFMRRFHGNEQDRNLNALPKPSNVLRFSHSSDTTHAILSAED